MFIILEVIIVLLALWLVAAPLLRNEQETAVEMEFEPENAERQRESIFTTLGEIEFDYQMHKLEKEDYEVLKKKYRSQAVAIIKEEEEDQLQDIEIPGEENLEDEIAREIEKEIEKEVQKLKKQKGNS